MNGGVLYQLMEDNININFPRDPDTLSIIREIEVYLEVPHKNIMIMNDCELHEYINNLIFLMI